MEAAVETKPHHGFNVMIKRKRRKMSQETLGELLGGKYQGDISKLESQEVIDDEVLGKIATILDCPVSELKDFDIDKAMSSYSVYNSNNTNNDNTSSYSGINQTIYNTSPELSQLYKDLLDSEKNNAEQERKIRKTELDLKDKEIQILKLELEKIKGQLSKELLK